MVGLGARLRATDLMVAQINQHPLPVRAYSCRGGEAVGTGRWLYGIHGGRSRLRSRPRNWPVAILTAPAWMILAFCAAAQPPASDASWSLKASRSGHGDTITAMAGRPSSCAAETRRVATRRPNSPPDQPGTTTAAAPVPVRRIAGPAAMAGLSALPPGGPPNGAERRSRLDPQAEQRNPPHTSGNGVSAA